MTSRFDHNLDNREDGLSHCLTCGGAEATMPTLCPGRRLTSDESALVQAGRVDFNRIPMGQGAQWLTALTERSYEDGILETVAAVQKILDGEDDGDGESAEPWGSMRKKIIVLRDMAVELAGQLWRLRERVSNFRDKKSATALMLLDESLQQRAPYPRMSEGVTIRQIVVNKDEKDVGFAVSGSRSTSDASRDLSVMDAALEFCYAKRRGVDIPNDEFVAHLMRYFK